MPKEPKHLKERLEEGQRQRQEADAARQEQVRRWVETRPRTHREPNGRDDKHPRRGHKNDWENQEEM